MDTEEHRFGLQFVRPRCMALPAIAAKRPSVFTSNYGASVSICG